MFSDHITKLLEVSIKNKTNNFNNLERQKQGNTLLNIH